MTPRPFLEEIVKNLTPGRALDLACGDGRNSVWLAEHGWLVTAVDKAPAVEHSGIKVLTTDLEQHEFEIGEKTWELIVMSYYLQRDLFPHILRGLTPGGVALVIVHMFEPGHETSRFSLHPGELREHFRDQQVIAYREGKPAPGARAVAQIAVRA